MEMMFYKIFDISKKIQKCPINGYFFIILVILLTSCSSHVVGGGQEQPCVEKTKSENVLKLKNEMKSLERSYYNLQFLSHAQSIDYTVFMNGLNEMENSIRKISELNANHELDKSLKNFPNEIAQLNNYAKKQDKVSLRRNLDKLYNMCFLCHAAHKSQEQ